MIPVLLATRMVIPVSRKGTEKSITFSRPEKDIGKLRKDKWPDFASDLRVDADVT